MTTDEKTLVSHFLYLAGDYLGDGHTRNREEVVFENDASPLAKASDPQSQNFSSLPLAYQIDESEEEITMEPLEVIAKAIAECAACPLYSNRSLCIPGEGTIYPKVLVLGDLPSFGKEGQLLDKMLESIGLSQDKNCFITSIVKCCPAGGGADRVRDPRPEEIAACLPYLEKQIALLKPVLILCAGRAAAQALLKTDKEINALRGVFAAYTAGEYPATEYSASANHAESSPADGKSIPVLCTFCAGDILRDESLKRPAWEDLKLLKAKLVHLKDENAVL